MTLGTPQISLYNTLTRTKEPFRPIDANNVRMYVCGPTVYDFAHIGNARPVIVFDVLFRLLRHVYGADHVTYVRNITDVDDKINARALRDYPDLPLNEAIRRVTETTARQYQSDVERLGNLPPTYQPRATEHIAGMIEMIQTLLDKGHAYVAQGVEGREALFDVHSMSEYGRLSQRRLEDQQAGARIEVQDHKRNPEDFVLWKESNAVEPGWDAELRLSDVNRNELHLNSNTIGIRGRPGWHIECSVMSEALLGKTFDIHGGGLDLIFPHHENEIAQSRCAHGTHAMANIWMHNGFLQVEGQKMSKSLGNFYTISQLLDTEDFGGRKWPGEVLRLAMLMTHYREPIDFSVRRLEEAETLLGKWERAAGEADIESIWRGPSEKLLAALVDDLNVSTIPHVLSDVLSSEGGDALIANLAFLGLASRSVQQYYDTGEHPAALALDALKDAIKYATPHTKGHDLMALEARGVDFPNLNSNVEARLAALDAKDFAKADAIRNELAEQGIALMDYKDETGQRQTKWEIKR